MARRYSPRLRRTLAQVAEALPFPTPLADLAANREVLLVELGGVARIAKVRIGDSEIAEDPFCEVKGII